MKSMFIVAAAACLALTINGSHSGYSILMSQRAKALMIATKKCDTSTSQSGELEELNIRYFAERN